MPPSPRRPKGLASNPKTPCRRCRSSCQREEFFKGTPLVRQDIPEQFQGPQAGEVAVDTRVPDAGGAEPSPGQGKKPPQPLQPKPRGGNDLWLTHRPLNQPRWKNCSAGSVATPKTPPSGKSSEEQIFKRVQEAETAARGAQGVPYGPVDYKIGALPAEQPRPPQEDYRQEASLQPAPQPAPAPAPQPQSPIPPGWSPPPGAAPQSGPAGHGGGRMARSSAGRHAEQRRRSLRPVQQPPGSGGAARSQRGGATGQPVDLWRRSRSGERPRLHRRQPHPWRSPMARLDWNAHRTRSAGRCRQCRSRRSSLRGQRRGVCRTASIAPRSRVRFP